MKRLLLVIMLILGAVMITSRPVATYAYTDEEKQQAKSWLSSHGYPPTRAGAEQAYQDYMDGKIDVPEADAYMGKNQKNDIEEKKNSTVKTETKKDKQSKNTNKNSTTKQENSSTEQTNNSTTSAKESTTQGTTETTTTKVTTETKEQKQQKEEKKKKERQREEEHGKGVMDEIRPEKWRIHPMELLVFALVIVIAVILFSKPWNYLIAIVLFLAFGLYIWNRMKVGKKQVKTEPEIILEEITQEEEKVPIEKLRWEKSHITAELKEKRIQYDNLGEQLAELDEVNERSREYEMKRQAVQMAADHLEQLSEEMRGYLKRDLNEKASSFICEITGGKYKKLVTDEKLHVSLMTDEKRVEIEQVSRGTVEQVYLALRMAVGELLCEEEMPVILDDAFAYYDEERMLQTLRWLKEHKKQVIIFTCQTREEQVMKEAGLVYHKIEL